MIMFGVYVCVGWGEEGKSPDTGLFFSYVRTGLPRLN